MTETSERPSTEGRSGAPRIGRPRTEPCGTWAGYMRHFRAGERPVSAHCADCAEAGSRHNAAQYQRRKKVVDTEAGT